MHLKIFSLPLSLIVSIFLIYSVYLPGKKSFSCIGEYSSEYTIGENEQFNNSGISLVFFRNSTVYVAVEGARKTNGEQRHINHEEWYKYEPVDEKSGLYKIYPTDSENNLENGIYEQKFNDDMISVEKKGRLIRLWKLSDNVILIGNAFSPIFSCTRLE